MGRSLFFGAVSALALVACGDAKDANDAHSAPHEKPHKEAHEAHHGEHKPHPVEAPAAGEDARVAIIGNDGSEVGEAVLTGGPNGMLIRVFVSGLSHGFHGLHLHQVGDCSDTEGFKLSGSHINPDGNAHGLMNEDGYEKADLPNIYAHRDGHAKAELFVAGLTWEEAMDDDGFALVVHENPDDHMTQPIGGAGARVACAAFN